jgi:hypothetical protein
VLAFDPDADSWHLGKERFMDRRTLIAGSLTCVALGAAVPASAGVANFDPKAFAAAQEAGEGIVVWVHAPW